MPGRQLAGEVDGQGKVDEQEEVDEQGKVDGWEKVNEKGTSCLAKILRESRQTHGQVAPPPSF